MHGRCPYNSGAVTPPHPVRKRWSGRWWVALAVATAAAVAASWLWRSAPPAAGPVTEFSIALPEGVTVSIAPPSVSPDGRRIAFAAGTSQAADRRVYVRQVDQPSATAIEGSEGGADPFFSPDGASVGFFAGGQLKSVPLAGGEVASLAAVQSSRGGAWMPDGRIVFAPDAYGPLFVVRADGGTAQRLTELDRSNGESSHRYPRVLPDGKIVFGILTRDDARPAIGIVDGRGGEHTLVIDRAMSPQPLASGHLLYAAAEAAAHPGGTQQPSAQIMAVGYRDGRVVGTPVPVLGRVRTVQAWGAAVFAAANETFVAGRQTSSLSVSIGALPQALAGIR